MLKPTSTRRTYETKPKPNPIRACMYTYYIYLCIMYSKVYAMYGHAHGILYICSIWCMMWDCGQNPIQPSVRPIPPFRSFCCPHSRHICCVARPWSAYCLATPYIFSLSTSQAHVRATKQRSQSSPRCPCSTRSTLVPLTIAMVHSPCTSKSRRINVFCSCYRRLVLSLCRLAL